jgi:hypothetical protein
MLDIVIVSCGEQYCGEEMFGMIVGTGMQLVENGCGRGQACT